MKRNKWTIKADSSVLVVINAGIWSSLGSSHHRCPLLGDELTLESNAAQGLDGA